MPSLAQIQFNADAVLDTALPTITAHQENFRGNRGRYWQGGQTHSVIPTHTQTTGGDSVPDRMEVSVGDNLATWANATPTLVGVSMPCALRVDFYDAGPAGKGWLLSAAFRFDGVVYVRCLNTGPNSYRAHGWQESEEMGDE